MSSKDTGIKRKNIQSREGGRLVKVSRSDEARSQSSNKELNTDNSTSSGDENGDKRIVAITSAGRNDKSPPPPTAAVSDTTKGKASTSSSDDKNDNSPPPTKAAVSEDTSSSAKVQTSNVHVCLSNENSELHLTGMRGGNAETVNVAANVYGNMGCTYEYRQDEDKASPFDNIVASTQKLIALKPENHVQTRAERDVPKILLESKCVFVKGKSGSGKTTLGLNVLREISKQTKRKPILLTSWHQWDLIPVSEKGDQQKKYVAMIDNIFGSCTLVQSFVDEWAKLFDRIWSEVNDDNILLILLSRPEILSMCQSEMKQYKLMENIQYIDLDKGEFALNREEKLLMLDNLSDSTLLRCEKNEVVELETGVGFPQCCIFFSRSVEAQQMGVKFFENPSMYILREVNTLHERDGLGYLVLLILLMKDGVLSDDELCIRPTSEFKTLVDDLKQCCQISDTPTMSQIRHKARALGGVFFTKTEDGFEFQHQSISDAVFLSISSKDLSICMAKCTPRLLVDYVRPCKKDAMETTVVVPNKHHGQLVDKITDFLLGELYEVILDHPCLHDEAFAKFIVGHWQDKKIEDIIEKKHKKNIAFIDYPILSFYKTLNEYSYCSLLAYFIEKSAHNLVGCLLTRLTTSQFATLIHSDALTCAIAGGNNDFIRMLLKLVHPTEECFRILCATRGIETDLIDIIFSSVHKSFIYENNFHDLFRYTVLMGNAYLVKLLVSNLRKSDFWLQQYSSCLEMFIMSMANSSVCDRFMPFNLSDHPNTIEEMIMTLLGTGCKVNKEKLVWFAASHSDATALRVLLEDDTVCLTEMYAWYINQDLSRPKTLFYKEYGTLRFTEVNQWHISEDLSRTISCTHRCIYEFKGFLRPQRMSAIHQAAAYGGIDCLSSLLARMSVSDINITTDTDINHVYRFWNTEFYSDIYLSPLHLAVFFNRVEHIKLLIHSGANLNIQTSKGKTPLHFAILRGHGKSVRVLLENHASSNVQDASEQYAAWYINEKPCKAIFNCLVDYGVDLHVTDNKGRNLLHGASQCGDGHLVEVMCEYGLDVNNSDNEGNTVLHVACWKSNLATIKYLCEKGAAVNAVNVKGRSVLHLACYNASPIPVLSYLLEEKLLDVNHQDKRGNAVLHDACIYRNLETVKYLCEKGAALDVVNMDGESVLHLACQHARLETVKFLCEKGAALEVMDIDGKSVLHKACHNIFPKAVLSYLLDDIKTELDVNMRDNDGNTVLHVASGYAGIDTVKYLCEKGASVNCVKQG